jgi:hypothetical protein
MDDFIADWQALAQCEPLVDQKAGLDALYRRYYERLFDKWSSRLLAPQRTIVEAIFMRSRS